MPKKSANGSGTIRKKVVTRNGKTYTYWEARITTGTDPGSGKQIQKSIYGKTQAEVRKKITEATRNLDQGSFLDKDNIKLSSWLDTWLEVYCKNAVKPLTYSSYKGIIKNHIKPALGSKNLQQITGLHIQKLYNDLLSDGLSPKTIKNISALLHKAFNTALKQGYIFYNPCNNAELPKQSKKDIKPLTREEIPRFLDQIQEEEYKNAYMLCLFAGLREGECLGLSWDQIDFKNKTITISQQLQRSKDTGDYYIANSTKSGKSRTIALPDLAVKSLNDERTEQLKRKLHAGQMWDNPYNLVFTNAAGGFISFTSFYKRFKKASAAIGRPDLRPHDLRHTAATVAIASGSDIKSVQAMLGHATAAFTLDVYAHASAEMLQDTASRMQEFYSKL